MGEPRPLGTQAHRPLGLVALPRPRVLVAPGRPAFVLSSVTQGGGRLVEADEEADAVVWTTWRDVEALREVLAGHPAVRWVQLPMAGVERLAEAGLFSSGEAPGVVWTCAKGCFAEPVAEHALCLALAGLRRLPERARARSWGEPAGLSLYGSRVTILGGGGIATSLLELLAPFRVRATVVRRTAEPLAGAERTVGASELHDVLPGSLVVFVALALSPSTVGVISRRRSP